MKRIGKIDIIELIDKYKLEIYFIMANLINTILFRINTSNVFIFRSLIFDIGFILLLLGGSFLIKKNKKLYFWISSLYMVACCVINSIYYNYYNSYASISLLATSVFVKDVGDTVIEYAIRPIDWIYLWEFIGLYIILKKKKFNYKNIKNKIIKLLVAGVGCIGIACALPPYDAFGSFIKLWNRVKVVNNFGVYIYHVDDIVQSLRPSFKNIFGYDKALKNTKEYYDKKDNNKKIVNEYTGIFEGKNVITIHAESLQTFTLGLEFNGKEVTPNINRLKDKGMYFNNYYAQVGVGTSSDSEFTYATGLMPSNNGTVFVNYYNNRFKTIQNLLNDKGYYVFSMHGNVGDFWNRDTMHINMGYDKFYSKNSFIIDEEYDLGLSDMSFFRQAVPKIKEINELGVPYYGTLITLTNHTPWKDSVKYSDYDLIVRKSIDGVLYESDYLYDLAIGKYLRAVNYMDKAIGMFIDELDKEGLLEDTVIVIYGDHDARLGKKQFEYLYNYDIINEKIYDEDDSNYIEFNDYDYEISKKVPYIIYSKDMEKGMVIDTPMGMFDAMPTIGNMLGVYNKYSLGQDIMGIDKDKGIVPFKDGSYITDKIYYSAKNNEAYMISNGVISEEYLIDNSKYVDDILKISNDIITYDLIKDLEIKNK